MKTEIHPEYNKNTKVNCVCGNSFTVGSTTNEINVEICSQCHPFYTGQEKIVDTAGRVEKFKARQGKVDTEKVKAKKTKKVVKKERSRSTDPKKAEKKSTKK